MSDTGIGSNRPLLPRSAVMTAATSYGCSPVPCQPNGTIAIGTGRSMPCVTLMLSCARALPAATARKTATQPASKAVQRIGPLAYSLAIKLLFEVVVLFSSRRRAHAGDTRSRSEEHTSEL